VLGPGAGLAGAGGRHHRGGGSAAPEAQSAAPPIAEVPGPLHPLIPPPHPLAEPLGLLLGLLVSRAIAVPQILALDERCPRPHHFQVDVAAGGEHLGHGPAVAVNGLWAELQTAGTQQPLQ
jgi:hypothetical protein